MAFGMSEKQREGFIKKGNVMYRLVRKFIGISNVLESGKFWLVTDSSG